MEDVYPLGKCSEIDVNFKKVTVVGNVDGVYDRGIYINDTQGRCKVMNVPKNVTGLIEVYGEVNRNLEIEARSFTPFTDSNFDFESHFQIIEYFRKFKDLN